MVIAYDLAKTESAAYTDIKRVADAAKEKNYRVIGMSASNEDWTTPYVENYDLGFSFYFTDETTLKTIIRSNPGVLVLEKGTILQKVHFNDLDELEFN